MSQALAFVAGFFSAVVLFVIGVLRMLFKPMGKQ